MAFLKIDADRAEEYPDSDKVIKHNQTFKKQIVKYIDLYMKKTRTPTHHITSQHNTGKQTQSKLFWITGAGLE